MCDIVCMLVPLIAPFPPPSATIPCYYRSMMFTLVSQVKSIPPPSKKTTPTPEASACTSHMQSSTGSDCLIECIFAVFYVCRH